MSNISQASKTIKKKLSFNDYTAQEDQNSTIVAQETSFVPEPSEVFTSLDIDTMQQKSNNDILVNQQEISMPKRDMVKTAKRSVGRPSRKTQFEGDTGEGAKVKVTHYLTEQEHRALIEIYIKRLQQYARADKSAIIAEALQLLYKKEIK